MVSLGLEFKEKIKRVPFMGSDGQRKNVEGEGVISQSSPGDRKRTEA